MRAAIYCRVSTTDQVENLSLTTQESSCRDYCAKHGYAVDEVFVDAGESAKTTQRPAFLALLKHCREQKGRVHAVIVYSLTRFSRNSADHHGIVALLRGLGITLRSVTEPIDETPAGKLMEGILAAMAQFDNDSRSERVTAGMKEAASRGRWVWPAPVGYLNADARVGPSLLPDPTRAPAILKAFTWCADGVVGNALLARVRAEGLTTKRGRPMTLARLYELLRHSVYAGELRTLSFQVDRAGDFDPIVPRDIFARVQAVLNRPERMAAQEHRIQHHPDFPLRRFLRCAVCDQGMTGSWSRGRGGQRYAFYHCTKGCGRVARDLMHAQFVEVLDALCPAPGYWALLKSTVLDEFRDESAKAAGLKRNARRKVGDLEVKLARLDDVFIFDRAIDDATYRQKRDEIREQLAIASIELSEARIDATEVESLLTFAERTLSQGSLLWTAAATLEQRVRVQWTLFPQGIAAKLGKLVEPRNCLHHYQLPTEHDEKRGWWTIRPLHRTADQGDWSQMLACFRHIRDGLKAA